MKKKLFDAIDEKIIRMLYSNAIPMTIGEISERTNISWITVKKHVNKLERMQLVERVRVENRQSAKVIWNFETFGNIISSALTG